MMSFTLIFAPISLRNTGNSIAEETKRNFAVFGHAISAESGLTALIFWTGHVVYLCVCVCMCDAVVVCDE